MKFEKLEIKHLLRMNGKTILQDFFNISEFTYKYHENTAFWIGNQSTPLLKVHLYAIQFFKKNLEFRLIYP